MHFHSIPEWLSPLAPSGPLQVVQAGPPVGVAQGRITWSNGLCSSGALGGSAEWTWISNYRKKEKKKAINFINFYSYWFSNLKKKWFFEYLSQMVRASSVLQAVWVSSSTKFRGSLALFPNGRCMLQTQNFSLAPGQRCRLSCLLFPGRFVMRWHKKLRVLLRFPAPQEQT